MTEWWSSAESHVQDFTVIMNVSVYIGQAPVEYQALMQMEYLDCVINESLRLYPIAPRLERVAKATVEINGLVIPKGMIVMVPTWPLHRHPDLWPDPEAFKPERYRKELNLPKQQL